MYEPLAICRRLRGQRSRGKGGHDLRGEPQRVDELACRLTPVDLDHRDRDNHLDRAARLVLELADVRAVKRVGTASAETWNVEQRCALADLLVRCERHPKRGSRQRGV